MLFENPALLYGGAMGLIPVVIHLINRSRAQVHPFAAIEFIILSNKRIARYFKLKQLLVLLLRIVILLCLVLALSKPYLLLYSSTELFRDRTADQHGHRTGRLPSACRPSSRANPPSRQPRTVACRCCSSWDPRTTLRS